MLSPVGIEPGPLIASDSKSNTILVPTPTHARSIPVYLQFAERGDRFEFDSLYQTDVRPVNLAETSSSHSVVTLKFQQFK